MNKFLKVLGAAALIAGLTPYRVETNEETGERKLKALLWQATKKPNPDGGKDDITINILSFGKDEEEEAHIFSDELTVDYSAPAESKKPEETDWEDAVESAEAMAAESAAAEEDEPSEEQPEQPVEE